MQLLAARKHMQFVFQDPFGSLGEVEGPVDHRAADRLLGGRPAGAREAGRQVLDLVGLDPARYANRHPRELSGGQAQRIAIARAVALNPDLLICDEGGLLARRADPGAGARLFEKLRRELGLSYLFIAHDLARRSAGQRPGRGDVPG